jgi:hypothetical protein
LNGRWKRKFRSETVIDREDRINSRDEKIGTVGFAAASTIASYEAVAMNHDHRRVWPRTRRGIVVHRELLLGSNLLNDSILCWNALGEKDVTEYRDQNE